MSSRKLVRCVSTCSEDILDDALNELSHLNQRHEVLRQQLFARKNNRGKHRPSGSVSSASSTSSSSMSSSFSSSSMSATLSSSESWDSFSDASDVSMCSSMDYPKIGRRLSKPKVNLFRPYCKPRRFSLQLGSHPESPIEGSEERSDQSVPGRPHSTMSMVCPSFRSQTPPKYSRLVSEKENFGSTGGTGSPVKVKSNPTSPSKCDLSSVLLNTSFAPFNAINERLVSQTSANSSSLASQSLTSSSGVVLIRSKSLDDLSLCSAINPFIQYQSSTALTLRPPEPSPSMATASSCDIDNVLQRISTLQVWLNYWFLPNLMFHNYYNFNYKTNLTFKSVVLI